MTDYKTLIDFPGVPAGEILTLDVSNPGNPSYVGTTNTNFWMQQSIVENNPDVYEAQS